ncbi:hypothetical protein FQN51_006618 [Onygenales sp. PD_10]|nr:hypothetical protein FQN51_006618 [Onygenales sp. PD_10]
MSRGQGERRRRTRTNGWPNGSEQQQQQQQQQQHQQQQQQHHQPPSPPSNADQEVRRTDTDENGGRLRRVSDHNWEQAERNSWDVPSGNNRGGSLYPRDIQMARRASGIPSRALTGHDRYDSARAYRETEFTADDNTGEDYRWPGGRRLRSPSPDFPAGRLSLSEPDEDDLESDISTRLRRLQIPSSSNLQNNPVDSGSDTDDSFILSRRARGGGAVRPPPGFYFNSPDGPTGSPDREFKRNPHKAGSGSNRSRRHQRSQQRNTTNIPDHTALRNGNRDHSYSVKDILKDVEHPPQSVIDTLNGIEGVLNPLQVDNDLNPHQPETVDAPVPEIINSRPKPSTDLAPPLPPKTPLPPPSQQVNDTSHNIANSPSRVPVPPPAAPVSSVPGDASSPTPNPHSPISNNNPVSDNPTAESQSEDVEVTEPKSDSNTRSKVVLKIASDLAPKLTLELNRVSNSESNPEPQSKPKTETKGPEQESSEKLQTKTDTKSDPESKPQKPPPEPKQLQPNPEPKQDPTQTQKSEEPNHDYPTPTTTTTTTIHSTKTVTTSSTGTNTTDDLSLHPPAPIAKAIIYPVPLEDLRGFIESRAHVESPVNEIYPSPPKYEYEKANAKKEEKSPDLSVKFNVPGDTASSSSRGTQSSILMKSWSRFGMTGCSKIDGTMKKMYQVRKCKKKEGGKSKGW